MSMLSAQIDELRQVAQVYRNLGKHATEQMLIDAADTILELRDDLQRANAENAKLREEFNKMDVWHSKELTAAMAENAKLRELVEDMLDCIDIQIAFERVPARWMQDEFAGRARELGIEVDE